MDRLFKLTVDFMKLSTRINGGIPEEVSNEVIEETEGDPETDDNIEISREGTESCQHLEALKILPEDSGETVRKKYGTLMKCYMDQTVDPCQDFFQYACGGWTEYHPIPKDRSGYDTFEILREDLHANLIAMFEEPISEDDSNATAAAKLLYQSCMDTGNS